MIGGVGEERGVMVRSISRHTGLERLGGGAYIKPHSGGFLYGDADGLSIFIFRDICMEL